MTAQQPASRPGPRELLTVALGALFLLAMTAWARPLMLPDEGRYAGVAWEMLHSGNWSTPMLNGLPFFHKPPLFYWISAAAMSVFGINAWAVRSASLLGGWVAIVGMFVFTYRWRDARLARWVTLVLLAQPLFFIGAQFANLDMLVAGCITATVLLAAHAALCQQSALPFRRALACAYVFAAFGVLAKGLIGIALPGMVIVVWLLVMQRPRVLLSLWSWTGLLLFLLITTPWFVVMQCKFPDFLDYFFVVQHFKRFAGSGFNNVQAWWFYPALLLLAHVVWAPWLHRTLTPSAMQGARRDPVRMLMLVWLLVVVVFFSIPKSKLIGYILPAVPPLVYLLCDSFTAQATPTLLQRRWWFAAPPVALAVALAVVAWLAVYPVKSTRDLALALRSARAVNEPVFMLGTYYYDVPFYARLQQAPVVISRWDDPKIPLADNWRKEMADAARFSPAMARNILVLPEQLTARVCAAPVSWLIGTTDKIASFRFLAAARLVYHSNDVSLWRLDRDVAVASRTIVRTLDE